MFDPQLLTTLIIPQAAVKKKLAALAAASEGDNPILTIETPNDSQPSTPAPKKRQVKDAATPKRTPAAKRKADAIKDEPNSADEIEVDGNELDSSQAQDPATPTPKRKAPARPRAKKIKTEDGEPASADVVDDDETAKPAKKAAAAPKKKPAKKAAPTESTPEAESDAAKNQHNEPEDETITLDNPAPPAPTPAKKAAAKKSSAFKKSANAVTAAADKAADAITVAAEKAAAAASDAASIFESNNDKDLSDAEPRGRSTRPRTRSVSRGLTPAYVSESEGSAKGKSTKGGRGRKAFAKGSATARLEPTIDEVAEEEEYV